MEAASVAAAGALERDDADRYDRMLEGSLKERLMEFQREGVKWALQQGGRVFIAGAQKVLPFLNFCLKDGLSFNQTVFQREAAKRADLLLNSLGGLKLPLVGFQRKGVK